MERHPPRQEQRTEQLALGLGWFSIGVGLAEVVAPDSIARMIGVTPHSRNRSVLRALGAREIGHGVAILMQPDSAPRVWSRVAGDAIDLGYLGSALSDEKSDRGRLAAAIASVTAVAALDVLCAQRLSQENGGVRAERSRAVHVVKAITINRPLEQVYQFWRNFENFPRFMRHLESVQVTGSGRSHWEAKGPAGLKAKWDAEITDERENELIAWRSLPGSRVENSGTVRFKPAPGARGTEVRVELEYRPPAGAIGRGLAWLFGQEPEQQVADDLRRFKQLIETGEIPLSDGPGLWRPAQPASRPEEVRSLAGVQQ